MAQKPRRSAGLRRFLGPWRVAVAEASMRPEIEAGDWLLVDPTTLRWPRVGSIVVFREPTTDDLAVKRVVAGPGSRVAFADGFLVLADDEAWLVSDADAETTGAAGYGEPIDSRTYGPVPVELLVGRAWFRYAPLRRLGPIRGVTRDRPGV
ncbi:MAG: S26 family signal peptidase [Chloroflexota bacterium]